MVRGPTQQSKISGQNGSTVLGSEYLGNTALFLLEPVDSLGRNFNHQLGKYIIKAGTGYL
ncbi:MAG: hypothetical protein GY951_15600 [Psychromonas sp.]|nr:hypothetical protein [Alteromonadales bacterium]MCP5079467.1 hypothetical protein [Psychromonas sp.]